ncbi:alpha/beta-hydrolase [Lentinus tigrinus ALCF2SS1-7]|uniref:Alpha/beta-hydrolase n=1 Tax=Lentinus tigrinus ALCF2SS1-6 TaxID=1328759 RepID=A0A5C2S664_9APHY|nr:alpha/beta-hydrolase [Lentinus tigrinus ALCF2SS1-6]RPD73549.1 alpha/beta-hydrolase [Lentinus tigrinus ALCF2SS1-7]
MAASQYIVSDKRVPVENPSGEITVRYVRPSDDGETYPVLVWWHGGGWAIGDLNMDDNLLRTIAVELKLAVVNVDYRLSPEYPFPTPVEDCYTALKWVAENAASLNIDLKKGFLVGGDSAGGNMSAAIALKARDDPFFASRPLTGQYLREPAVAFPGAHPEKYKAEILSFDKYTDTPLLNKELTLRYFAAYGCPPSDLRVSPLLASSHAGLPPAFIQVQEFDPVHDDGPLYEKVLREAGVPVKLIEYAGCLHSFHYMFPSIGPAVKLDRDARDGLRWLLSHSK